jgi:ABC-type uncharacterized transport system involved in gliding motility auxiliary subunit
VPSLKVAEKPGTVYLIADADLVGEQASIGQNGEPRNANLPFVMNMIDDLAGNAGLIQARSRISAARPFTKLNEILEQTNKGIRDEEKKVEEEIAKWKSEITTKASKKANNGFIMVDQKEMDQLNTKVAEGEAKKRELRKDLRKNIESKFSKYHMLNIFGIPALTLLAGLIIVLVTKSRSAAR